MRALQTELSNTLFMASYMSSSPSKTFSTLPPFEARWMPLKMKQVTHLLTERDEVAAVGWMQASPTEFSSTSCMAFAMP